MMKTDIIHNRLWQTQLELIQVCYRNRLSQPVEQFIARAENTGELIFNDDMALDPQIRHHIQIAYNQIFNRSALEMSPKKKSKNDLLNEAR